MGGLIYLRDVVTLELNRELCVRCGMCTTVCPHAVFDIDQGLAHIAERDACMECGACSKNCPTGAIAVKAGVGCAQAVINTMLGRKSGSCCCTIESDVQSEGENCNCNGEDRWGCC